MFAARIVSGALLVWAAVATTTWAEVAPRSPEELQKDSTNIVTGEVQAVYSRTSTDGNYLLTQYVAEVVVSNVEKGDDVKPGELIYVRYWRREWKGKAPPPPGAYGHWLTPKANQKVKIYCSRKTSDGFVKRTDDGGLNVLLPNGFEEVK